MSQRPIDRKTEAQIIDRNRDAGDSTRTPSLSADLDRLFDAHRDSIYKLCLRLTSDPARAEELTQESLLVAYRRLPEFNPQARFGTWLYSIARNLCLNANRKRGELLSEDGVIDSTDPVLSVLSQLRAQERAELVQQAAEAVLDEIEQQAVYLRYVENIPQAEITRLLSLDGSGARGVLQRCRRKLGRELRRQLELLGHGESLFMRTI